MHTLNCGVGMQGQQGGGATRPAGMSWAAVTGRGAAAGEGGPKSNRGGDSGEGDERRSKGGENDGSGGGAGEGGEGADAAGAGRSGWDSVSSWNHSWNTKPATPPGNKDKDPKSSWANVVGGAPKGSWANVVGVKGSEEGAQSGSKHDAPSWPQVLSASVVSMVYVVHRLCMLACLCQGIHFVSTNFKCMHVTLARSLF